ncbi:MAG: hypothetical protein HOP12_09295 [Candidatus Eisenbacteria bacterium]|uniref:Uncharacterized protein n=1 Tax=Eiseniibacteriota bacterium TaxID=2212470 RepID=A0A849SSJ6_UNCEI|nr:hypothetical protein [Candidatus Eisenbacteria bacterium]
MTARSREEVPAQGAAALEVFLRSRGCPDFVVDAGLDGLIARWEEIAAEVAKGYAAGLDDWLNDMDGRQLIEDSLPIAGRSIVRRLAARLEAADEIVRSHLVSAGRCVWGAGLARQHGWTAEREWWYFHVPRNPAARLKSDLVGG